MNWWDWLAIVVCIGLLALSFYSVIKYYKIIRFNDVVLKLKNNPYVSIIFAVFGLLFSFSAISRINKLTSYDRSISYNINGIINNIVWALLSFTWVIRNAYEYTIIVSNGIAINLKMIKWSEIVSWKWKDHKDYEMDYTMVLTTNNSVKKKKSSKTIAFRVDEKYKEEVEKILNEHIQRAKVEE